MNKTFRKTCSISNTIKNKMILFKMDQYKERVPYQPEDVSRDSGENIYALSDAFLSRCIYLLRKMPGFHILRRIYWKICACHEVCITRDAILLRLDRQDQLANSMLKKINALNDMNISLLSLVKNISKQVGTLGNDTQKLEVLHHMQAHSQEYMEILLRSSVIPCGDVNLVRTVLGYVAVSSSDYAVQTALVEGGELESETRALISSLLHPGDCYVDVGTNLGLLTLVAGRTLNGQGKLICFEPFPQTCSLLRHTLFINGLAEMATVHCAACSDHSGTLPLHIGATCGHHSLYGLEGATDTGETTEVNVVSLDEVLGDTAVTLLKIDAEGAEFDIICGAARVLENTAGLVVEFGVSHLKRTGHTTDEFLNMFTRLGFEWRAITNNGLASLRQADLEAVSSINLFFARPESFLWERVKEDSHE